MKSIRTFLLAACILASPAIAQVPQLINYQGRVAVDGVNFDGTGQFKFALVNEDGTVTYWSNDGTSAAGSEPAVAVSLAVTKGLYSVQLGDTAVANMDALPATAFTAADVRLRVWFDDGTHGWQMLSPDSRFAAVPYAMHAGTAAQVADGAISDASLASGAVTTAKIATGAVTVEQLNFTGAPNVGQVLGFDGANLTWLTASGGTGGGSLTLPFSGLASSTGALLSINNTGATGDPWAIYGHSQASIGVFGQTHAAAQAGVLGRNDDVTGLNGAGVFGYASTGAHGVLAISEQGNGVWAETKGFNVSAVYGQADKYDSVGGRFHHLGVGTALTAEANGGWAIFGRSQSGLGVFGQSITDGTGVLGRNESNSGQSVHGYSAAGATGVRGDSVAGDGVIGNSTGPGRSGVAGFSNQPAGNAVLAFNAVGTGVFAKTEAAAATAGFFWNSAGGDAIRTTGNVFVDGRCKVRILEIIGGADLAEPFPMSQHGVEPGAVVVIDEAQPGRLRLSSGAYDRKVAGVVSGANGIRPGISMIQEDTLEAGENVALSGRVYVAANTSAGAIRPGDMLTTSDTPGEAMRATDHTRAQGAILGKAMTSLAAGERGHVLVLVTLQ